MYYRCPKIKLNRSESYIDSPDWIKNKKATINPVNKRDNRCSEYAITFILNLNRVKKDPQRIIKIKPFTNKYNWEEINFPSKKDDWKTF